MNDQTLRPDFLIIGAAKSATSWLATTLRQDERCFVPVPEIHYFTRHFDRPWSWYADLFAEAKPGQLIGEKSNTYLSDLECAQRIHAVLPDVKLLVVLRNPLDRAYSAYCMQFDRGKVDGDINKALHPTESHVPHTLTDGLYAACLRPYLEHFAPEQLFITTFERQFSGAEATAEVGQFLNLTDPPLAPRKGRVNAKKEQANAPLWAKRLLWPLLRSEELRTRVMGLAKKSGLVSISSKLAGGRKPEYPEFTDALKDRLRDYYARDLAELSAMLNHDFTPWLRGEKVDVARTGAGQPVITSGSITDSVNSPADRMAQPSV